MTHDTNIVPVLHTLTTRYRIFHEEGSDYLSDRTPYEELHGNMCEVVYVWGRRPPTGVGPVEWLGMSHADRAKAKTKDWLIAVSTENGRRHGTLSRMAGAIPFSGCVVLFPAEQVDEVAQVIHARKQRRGRKLSPQERAKLVELGSGTQFQKGRRVELKPRGATERRHSPGATQRAGNVVGHG